MKKNKVKIQKIHLESFIDMLMDLYEDGVLYFDLLASLDSEQDVVQILVKDEYIQVPPDDVSEGFLNSLI